MSGGDYGSNSNRTPAKGLAELYCDEYGVERPLKLLIVGHNPSDQSWEKGHYYANPSNRMWPLLAKAAIVPPYFTAAHDKKCPGELGIGFTDIMSGVAETHSASISDSTFQSFKHSFYRRVTAHVDRVRGGTSGGAEEDAHPRVIAFAGVRQWKAIFPASFFDARGKAKPAPERGQPSVLQLFGAGRNKAGLLNEGVTATTPADTAPSSSSRLAYGVQTDRPADWPPALKDSVVFLLPSSSGAAAMTTAEREGPYLALGQLLQEPRLLWVPGKGLRGMQHLCGQLPGAVTQGRSEASRRTGSLGPGELCTAGDGTPSADPPSGGSVQDAIELD
jgi:TDG/mug DNA glycosylase family protein